MISHELELPRKDLFAIGVKAGKYLLELEENTRDLYERKRSVDDDRPSFLNGINRREAILSFLDSIHDGLPPLAYQYSRVEVLREQIENSSDPIEFGKPKSVFTHLTEFAGALAITADGTKRFARGVFNDNEIWAAPGQSIVEIRDLHYQRVPMEFSRYWSDHQLALAGNH